MTRAVGAAVALLFALTVTAADPAIERWFEMRLANTPCGYVHESFEALAPDALRTTVESRLVINRLGASTEIRESEVSVEDRDGHLKTVHLETRASLEATVLDAVVEPGQLRITTGAGGRSYQRILPETRPLLGPEGIREATRRWLADSKEPLRYATFVAELGAVADVIRRMSATADEGADATLRAVDELVAGLPVASQLRVDRDGRVVATSEQSPFGAMTLSPSTDAARAAAEPRPAQSDDRFSSVLVRTNIRLPDPTAIERLRVRIDLERPELGWPELEGPGQHVIERSANHVVLEVTRSAMVADTATAAPAGDPATAANFILQSDHPDVVALAAELRRPDLGRYAQARVLQDWVATHMHFDAGLALVPASEVARDRRGTCVGYAVLLASLARSLGIPARIVMGYVYAANAFGGHAWVEIRMSEAWLPLDAAVYRPGPADAARIAVVRHSAEHGAASGAGELLRLFGNTAIRIDGYALHGRWVTVGRDARPFTIEGDAYRNPWLGLTVRKPAGFSFVATDASYPDPTVVGLRDPRGGEIRLQQLGAPPPGTKVAAVLAARGYAGPTTAARIDGRPALKGVADGRAALSFRLGGELWLLEASGSASVAALDDVARHIRIERQPR